MGTDKCSVPHCNSRAYFFYIRRELEPGFGFDLRCRCKAHMLRAFETFGGTWRRLSEEEYLGLMSMIEVMDS